MLAFRVDDMACGHCVSTIRKAVASADAGAKLDIDLGRHLVRSEPAAAPAEALAAAIRGEGYTPVAVEPGATGSSPEQRRAHGCGCG